MMRNPVIKKSLGTLLLCIFAINFSYSWGAWGHIHINRGAIFALPEEMKGFYYNHVDFITEGSVVPDLRRGVLNDKPEPPRHFLDLEDFKNYTLDNLPRSMAGIYKEYDSSFLQKSGILPWYIQNLTGKLTDAFKKRNKSEILFLSAELGHYIGDAHVPLHTTTNYNGQLTNQTGIHSFWESTLPEKFGMNYNFNVESAKYIDNIAEETFRIIKESNSLVQPVLQKEKEVLANMNTTDLYRKNEKGEIVKSYNQPIFSDLVAEKYNASLGGMVENQMRSAIADLSNFWYTAWINGGKPDLTSLDDESITKMNRKNFNKEVKLFNKGKLVFLKIKE